MAELSFWLGGRAVVGVCCAIRCRRGIAMQAHIVLAHPEPKSFNAHLAGVARTALEAQGWSVSITDLYGVGFDPCERAEHYAPRLNAERFDVQAEQRHASAEKAVPDAVTREI